MGEITLEEFARGMISYNVKDTKDLANQITYTREELLDTTTNDFKQFWSYLFKINLEKKSQVLRLEVCKLYIDNLLSLHFTICSPFLTFVEKEKKLPGLKQDEWNMFLQFCIELGAQFPTGYKKEDYWPILFDEYYDHHLTNNK